MGAPSRRWSRCQLPSSYAMRGRQDVVAASSSEAGPGSGADPAGSTATPAWSPLQVGGAHQHHHGRVMVVINGSITIIALPAIFRGIRLNPLAPGNSSYFLWVLMGFLLITSVLVPRRPAR